MTTRVLTFLVGIAFLFSVYETASGLSLESNIPILQEQQNVAIGASLFVPQGDGQNSCFGDGCHQEFNYEDSVSTHDPFTGAQCEQCHLSDPHRQRSNWTADDELALCYACHSVESLGTSHPMGEEAIDPNTGNAITCVTCHSPHYSNHTYRLILDGRGELCLHCHTEFLQTSQ